MEEMFQRPLNLQKKTPHERSPFTIQEYKNDKCRQYSFARCFSTYVKLGSVKLREKRKLRVFKNSVLSIIFCFIMDEVTGDWQEVHNEELQNLHSSPYIIRVSNQG
jgi:hypothetical protein